MRLFARDGLPRLHLIFFYNFERIVLFFLILAEPMVLNGRMLPSPGPCLSKFADTALAQGRIVGRWPWLW